MNIKVKRREGAERINRFSTSDFPSLEFSNDDDVFEVPILMYSLLEEYFEPFFPEDVKEKEVKEFMLNKNNKKVGGK